MSTRDLEGLAKAVRAARLALHPSRLAAAQAAGISKDTWKRVEEGEEVREVSYAKIETALRWPIGTCADIAAGAPTPTPTAPDDSAEVTVRTADEVDEEVRDIVQLSAIATTPGLTGEEIRKLSDRIARDLRAAGKLQGSRRN